MSYISRTINRDFENAFGNSIKDKPKPRPKPKVVKVSVEEIHKEFLSQQEAIIKDANDIIASTPVEPSKAKIAEQVVAKGFSGIDSLNKVIDHGQTVKTQKKKIELLKEYELEYPMNKVITDTQIKALCEKYGLVFGQARDFKSDIPESNLKDIAEFKLKVKHCTKQSWKNVKKLKIRHHPAVYMSDGSSKNFSGKIVDNSNFDFSDDPAFLPENHMMQYPNDYDCEPVEGKVKYILEPMMVIANKEDFPGNFTVRDGYRLEEVNKDPIVVQPIKGLWVAYYLIVTAWGKEAEDDIVKNPKKN